MGKHSTIKLYSQSHWNVIVLGFFFLFFLNVSYELASQK